MKPKGNKEHEEPVRKFVSSIPSSFLDSKTFAADKPIQVQCLKTGKFRHPWWGVMSFDDAFFDRMIVNFDADLPSPEIAFDFKHQPDHGAAAWVSKLFKEPGMLMAEVNLTAKGKKSIEDKEFRFFSIEYTDDYVEYLFEDSTDESGNPVDKETKISHGPTVLGGGLTNRPFIKGMLPVSLSEDGDMLELTEIPEDDSGSNKEVNKSMKKTLEELQTEQADLKAKITALEEAASDKKESKEELTALTASLEEVKVAIVKLEKPPEKKKKKEDTPAPKTVSLEEFQATNKALEEAQIALKTSNASVAKLSGDVSALTDSVKSLMGSNKELQNDKLKIFTEKKLAEFKGLGAFPATLKVIENVALSEPAKKFSVTLSEGEGDNAKEVTKSFLDIAEDILASIPEEHRFDDGETSASVRTPTGKLEEASIEDVEAYATEHKITFEDALVVFSQEGKLDEE
jgi:phage I-like protein